MTPNIRHQIANTISRLCLFIFFLVLTSCQSGTSPRHDIFDPRPLVKEDIRTRRKIPDSHKVFLARFLPEIHKANNKILVKRNAILGLLDSLDQEVIGMQGYFDKLNSYLREFRIDPVDPDTVKDPQSLLQIFTSLLRRADVVPVKLVMAQAIIESGWGSSNFAREANNYFGMRCYSENCGMKPAGIDSSNFLVKVYPTEMAGIEDYLWTLNTGYAYRNFRRLRAQMRMQDEPLDPVKLSGGLIKYSENGDEYLEMVSNIIRNYIPQDVDALLASEDLR